MDTVNIYVVEDSKSTLVFIKNSLLKRGYNVIGSCAYGEEAIKNVEISPPDLILMDIILEGKMDGIEAAEIIRSKIDVPIIFLSKVEDDCSLNRAIDTRPYSYIIKPFKEKELYSAIEIALNNHKLETELRESRELFKNVIESSNDGMFILDDKGIVQFANSTALSLFNLKQDNFINHLFGLPFFICNSVEIDIIRQGLSPGIGEMSVTNTEWEGKRANFITIHDITERKQATDQLFAEKERLAVILSSIADGVIAANNEGKIVFLNRSAEKLTGWTVEEAVGKIYNDIFSIINDDNYRRNENPIQKVLETGESIGISNHSVFINRCKEEIVIAENAAPIRNNDGNTIGVVLVFRDVTNQKKMEQEILKVEKLKSIGILAGGIAHDFNNILVPILGNISLAKLDVDPDSEIAEILTDIEDAAINAKNLVQQLLPFAKGGMPTKETASITEVIKETAIFILRGSNVSCDFFIVDNIWPVNIDYGQMSQVINNLIINASQSMPDGGIIQVRVENIPKGSNNQLPLEDKDHVKISIKDHGTGISKENISHIFDPYFTTKEMGNGLGLSISYTIVKNHDGHITVQSIVGVGSEFSIYLPASPIKEVQKKGVGQMLLNGKGRILVMDDDVEIRKILGKMIKHMGYDVDFAQHGVEAIELYMQSLHIGCPYDAVIMDLTIPGGMGGKETIRRLKNIDPNIRSIVSSGYSGNPIMTNYSDFGFCGFVAKPYKIQELSDALHNAIMINS